MYGCAMTCSETSSSLGVSQTCFSPGLAWSAVRPAWGFRSLHSTHSSCLHGLGMNHSWHDLPGIAFRVPRFVLGRAVYCCSYCLLSPGAAVGIPGFRERFATQISAYMRNRRNNLDPAVWQHQQRRWWFCQVRSQTFLYVERNVAKFHVAFNRCGVPFQHREEFAVRPRQKVQLVPQPRGGTDAHQPAGIEAEGTKLARVRSPARPRGC